MKSERILLRRARLADYTSNEISEFEKRRDARNERKAVPQMTSERLVRIRAELRARERESGADTDRKERDRRLRKLIVDLKTLHLYQEAVAAEEKITKVLARESHQEEEIRYEIHKARQFEHIIVQNKLLFE